MLSLAKVGTGAAAAGYYEGAGDYYADGSPSQWMGDGAVRLGLSGEVDPEIFRAALDGQLPDGTMLHNAAEGRRGGSDMTFSCPKSISMQALIGGDHRLQNAHDLAVEKALDYAEKLAMYRTTENGQTRQEISANLLVASFRHDLSRAHDPHIHTHCVAINATQRPDGEWRSLDATQIYRQKMLIGALYRSELALEVQKLGYHVRTTHADGRFELAQFSPRQIEAFSQRSQAIENDLASHGLNREEATARQKQVSTLATRQEKTSVDRQVLQTEWQEKSQAFGIDYQARQLAPLIPDREKEGMEALAFAIEHIGERQSVFTKIDLTRSALENGVGRTDMQAVDAAIEKLVENGELVRAGNNYTTEVAQEQERQLLALELRGRHSVAPIMSQEKALQQLANLGLNAGQQGAAALILTTDSQHSAVQGSAGTGKTTMIREARKLAEQQGYRLIGVAPSAAAANELAGSGISSQTLASFNRAHRVALDERSVVILDEAGMVSSKDMLALFQRVEVAKARVVLLGDVQQLKAIEAGKPFAQLQNAGMARAEMGEIQRQKDAQLKQAVELAARGDIGRSVAILSGHIHEIESASQRHQQIAKDYAEQTPEKRAQSVIVAGTRAARNAINQNVRTELGLAGQGVVVATLERLDMTAAQARMSQSYQVGDLVQAQKPYEGWVWRGVI